jgi:hypothetical protein
MIFLKEMLRRPVLKLFFPAYMWLMTGTATMLMSPLPAYADAVALPELMNAYEFNDGTSFSTSSPKFDPTNGFNNRIRVYA